MKWFNFDSKHTFYNSNWKKNFKKKFGFKPSDWHIYFAAFTHKSKYYSKTNTEINFERLELIGDSVLSLVIAEYFFNDYNKYSEGDLSKIRSRLVNRKTLNYIGNSIAIVELIYSEFSENEYPPNLPGNVLEAFIGALYFDKGIKFTKKYLIHKIFDLPNQLDVLLRVDEDYKSIVFVWAQKRKKVVTFKTKKQGITNDSFKTELYIDNDFITSATGFSKKEAEQLASSDAIRLLNIWIDN